MIYKNVGELIQGQLLRSVSEDKNIYEACAVLDEFNIGALAVMRQGRLVGIISERDVIRRVVMKGRHFIETKVAEVMTPDPQVIDASAGLVDALNKMITGHFRHLPVLQGGSVTGMLSIRSIPVEYWYMKQRFEEIVTTPAAVAETAVNQHQPDEPGEDADGLALKAKLDLL